ncbi:MAG TPA: multiubiquitin domain-containing protein [Ignavibacteria bacterium]|jgi:hypothetical protein
MVPEIKDIQSETGQISDADDKDKIVNIIVNGTQHTWSKKEISFDEVIILAYGAISPDPNIVYTVTYKRGHGNKPEGILDKGDSVKVKEGMIFNVTFSNKS